MSGRDDRGRTLTARERRPHLSHYYRRHAGQVHPGDYDVRIQLRRPGAKKRNRVLHLARATTFVEWSDDGPALSGSISLMRPDPDAGKSIPIARGDAVKVSVRGNHRWRKLWTMRVEGEPTVDLFNGSISATLGDDLFALDKGEREWDFKDDHDHPHGWTADEIAQHVCRKENVKIGRLAKGKKKIKKLKDKCSGLAIIKQAYAEERDETGVHFVMRFRNGRFDVVPVRRNKILYEIKSIEQNAQTSGQPNGSRPTTSIEAHARVDDDKVTVKIVADRAAARFGLITKEVNYGKMGSRHAVRNRVLRHLARELDPHRQADITIPMIPFIERGDTIRWRTKEPGWHGADRLSANRQFCFVSAVTHSITPESQTSALHVTQRDPMKRIIRDIDKAERKQKQQDRDGKGN